MLSAIELDEDDRRIAVFGDMLELGPASERLHKDLGTETHGRNVDLLVAVGERARDIARGARDAGMTADRVVQFATPEEAGKWLQGMIKIGDVLLVKGSQGARMEKVVKELMAEPLRASQVLVRQDPPWV